MATIVLDHEGRCNALTKDMWQQFGPILAALEVDESVKVVVVRGAGENFSAGADITDLKEILLDAATGRQAGGHASAGENALAQFAKPTIAAIDGYCIGGAWQIAGACDIRFATDRATFGITPSKIGIVYPLSGIDRLVRLAGPATAKYLLFSGDIISATEAKDLGLLAKVVPHPDFWQELTGLAERLSARSQLSIHARRRRLWMPSQGEVKTFPRSTHTGRRRWLSAENQKSVSVRSWLSQSPNSNGTGSH